MCDNKPRCTCILLLLLATLFSASCARRADTATKPQKPPTFEFLGSWEDKGDGPGKLNAPVTFAVDNTSCLFFADAGEGFVHKFKSDGTPLLSFEDAHALHASGIAVDSGGAIYLVDAESGIIQIYFPNGDFLRSLHMPPQRGLTSTLAVDANSEGHIYAPDVAGSRVLKYDVRGRLLKAWKVPHTPPALPGPWTIATAQDGSVFIAYMKTGRIERYSGDGAWIASWNASGQNSDTGGPLTGFAVAGQFVFTVDAAPARVRIWTLDGQKKLDDDLGGRLVDITAPQIAATREEFFVFDPAAPRILRFRMHL